MWESGELLHEGAEATVTEGFWLGRKAVLKSRRPRAYRHPDLDRRLTKQRLSVEARVLSKLSDRDSHAFADLSGSAKFSDSND